MIGASAALAAKVTMLASVAIISFVRTPALMCVGVRITLPCMYMIQMDTMWGLDTKESMIFLDTQR